MYAEWAWGSRGLANPRPQAGLERPDALGREPGGQVLGRLAKNGVTPPRCQVPQGKQDESSLVHPGMRKQRRPLGPNDVSIRQKVEIKTSGGVDRRADPTEGSLGQVKGSKNPGGGEARLDDRHPVDVPGLIGHRHRGRLIPRRARGDGDTQAPEMLERDFACFQGRTRVARQVRSNPNQNHTKPSVKGRRTRLPLPVQVNRLRQMMHKSIVIFVNLFY